MDLPYSRYFRTLATSVFTYLLTIILLVAWRVYLIILESYIYLIIHLLLYSLFRSIIITITIIRSLLSNSSSNTYYIIPSILLTI